MWHGERSIAPVLSYPMSEHHLLAACRYVELNPVRAGLGKEAWSYKWSRAAAHIEGSSGKLVRVESVVPRQLDANNDQNEKQKARSRT